MKQTEFMDRLVEAVKRFVAGKVDPLTKRVDEIDVAVKAIPAGKDGAPGVNGKDGAPGERGEKGETGLAGKDGSPGERGERGEKGLDGSPGKAGERGEKGEPGVNGKDGAPGPRGEKGADGIGGKDGAPGKDGRDGREGKDGLNGKDGAPGRDAFELDILPAIDERRSYPRGTFAKHRNGLWRAIGNTDGMRGWDCVVAGVHSVIIDRADERDFTVGVELSAGEAMLHRFALPIVLDRGVYVPDHKYAKGDGVTFGGSWWIAQVDGPTDKPGIPGGEGGNHWRLAVKRGRDGKDAR